MPNENKTEQETIKNVLETIFSNMEKDDNKKSQESEMYKFLIEELSQVKNVPEETEFYFFTTHPFNTILKSVASKFYECKDFLFLDVLLNIKFYEHNLNKVMANFYGSACSVDKSRNVIRTYLKKLKTGNLEKWGKSYSTPETCSQNLWTEYMESLNDLYYGNVDRYLLVYQKLISQHNKEYNSEEFKREQFLERVDFAIEKLEKYPEPEIAFPDRELAEKFKIETELNLSAMKNISEQLKDNNISIDEINVLCSNLSSENEDKCHFKRLKFGQSSTFIEEHHHKDPAKRIYHIELDNFWDSYRWILEIKKGLNLLVEEEE